MLIKFYHFSQILRIRFVLFLLFYDTYKIRISFFDDHRLNQHLIYLFFNKNFIASLFLILYFTTTISGSSGSGCCGCGCGSRKCIFRPKETSASNHLINHFSNVNFLHRSNGWERTSVYRKPEMVLGPNLGLIAKAAFNTAYKLFNILSTMKLLQSISIIANLNCKVRPI